MRAALNSKELLICTIFATFLLAARPCLAQDERETDTAARSDTVLETPRFQTSLPFILPTATAFSTLIKSPLPDGTLAAVESPPAVGPDHDAPDSSAPPAQAGFPYGPTRRQLTEIIDPDKLGSTNVPMDSWVYPALERLAAMGYIPTQSVAIRPWARKECLRQLREAENEVNRYNGNKSMDEQAELLISDLRQEFEDPPDSNSVVLSSAYNRYGTIIGPAITDSYHFGQTWWNDFGRPLGRGTSVLAGVSGRATYNRYFVYAREEFQHNPGTLARSDEQAQFITSLDGIPNDYPASPAISAFEHVTPIELYAGVAFGGNALSFGKQEIYWGPTVIGPLSFSSNAEPTYNLRLVSTRPHPLPLLSNLGTYRFDFVFGKLSGHQSPNRPYFNGAKIDFNFGRYLELSFTRWSILWGVGHPMTLGSLKDNIFSFNSTGSGIYGSRNDPGDRKSDFDFRLHVPGLSKYVTIYADSYADDEPSPIDAPRRVVWSPGIYFPRLPLLPHMDLRVEAASTNELSHDEGGIRVFWNEQYHDANLNKGFLLGTAVGRDGRAIEGRSGYWFSARTRVEAGYRQNKISAIYLPGGGTITDGFVNASYSWSRNWSAQLFTQYERFIIPSYMSGNQHNESGWLQITWTPNLKLTH
jgi:Capsule assembly protein Wzi